VVHHEALAALDECRHPMVALIHRYLRRRRTGDRRAVRPAHLRRVEPLRHSHQPSRVTLGLSEMRALMSLVGKAITLESCSKVACSAPRRRCKRAWSRAWCRTTRSRKKPTPRRGVWRRRPAGGALDKKFMRRLHDPAPLTPAN